jgi:hypothetical protein
MKTVLKVVIESLDKYDNVYPYSLTEKPEEDYETEDDKQELQDFRDGFAVAVHDATLEKIEKYLSDFNGDLSMEIINEISDREYGIEDWDELSDYNIKITVKRIKEESLKETERCMKYELSKHRSFFIHALFGILFLSLVVLTCINFVNLCAGMGK